MIGILGKDQGITNKENVEVETVNEPFGIFFLHDMKIYKLQSQKGRFF